MRNTREGLRGQTCACGLGIHPGARGPCGEVASFNPACARVCRSSDVHRPDARSPFSLVSAATEECQDSCTAIIEKAGKSRGRQESKCDNSISLFPRGITRVVRASNYSLASQARHIVFSPVQCSASQFFSIRSGLEEDLRVHRKSRSSTVRRMGAWVDDRFVVEEVVPLNQGPKRRTCRVLGQVCDGAGPGALPQLPLDWRTSGPSASLLPLRRQFTRQLYEWPCLPLFKSRTKLDQF